jgi:hypothetical protein
MGAAATDPARTEPGIEFTTFSLAGRCERTGMLGIAIATSEMAVGEAKGSNRGKRRGGTTEHSDRTSSGWPDSEPSLAHQGGGKWPAIGAEFSRHAFKVGRPVCPASV